jgi:hypothetical protein
MKGKRMEKRTMNQNQSEVARWRQQYEAEYEAAQRGLTGLAYGAARHDFITRRMENMQRCVQQLTDLVGTQQACTLLWGKQTSLVSHPLSNDAPGISPQEEHPCSGGM